MTHARLRALLGLSLVATVFVLADGGGRWSWASALEAAVRHPVVVHAALPPAAQPDVVPAAATAPGEPASDVTGGSAHDKATGAVAAAAATPKSPGTTNQPTDGNAAPQPSKVKHVFLIALSGPGQGAAFAAGSAAHYLATELRPRGTLLSGFRPLTGADLPNYLAMTGGQPPNADTEGECATFSDFPAATAPGDDGVVPGTGCLYPNTVLSIGDQLTAAGRTWRAYMEDMGSGASGAASCRHPQPGSADDTLRARPGDGYATRHNPFVYFHSLLDLGDCMANDVELGGLATDLRNVSTTPDYAFIAPNLCDGGTESPCVDGRPGGLATADAFLQDWVPRILSSPAYKRDGLLIIAFLSSAAPPAAAQTTTTSGSTTPPPATDSAAGAASAAGSPARTGVLLISPFRRGPATIAKRYDPYSLLRSLEDLFGLTPLAKANGASGFAKAALPRAFAG